MGQPVTRDLLGSLSGLPDGQSGTRGILNPVNGFAHFSLHRELPHPELSGFLQRFWSVTWDLEGQRPFQQEILPNPCVNLSSSPTGFEIHGPGTRRFLTELSGRGRVCGAKFTPAGFRAFSSLPAARLVDCVLSVTEVTGRTPCPPADDNLTSFRPTIENFLRTFESAQDQRMDLANELVALAQADRSISRAENLARVAGMSVRSLYRLFEHYIGVSPKWVIRRSRVQQAADEVALGQQVDWSQLAQELGYHDQAHFIRDFRDQVGFTPGNYARCCAAAVARH